MEILFGLLALLVLWGVFRWAGRAPGLLGRMTDAGYFEGDSDGEC